MTLPLTPKQELLWRFLRTCTRSPSFEEMRAALGLRNKSQVSRLLDQLEERGFIQRIKNKERAVVPLDMPDERPSLAGYDDAELIEELERRTKAALRHAGDLDTRKMSALTDVAR